MVCVNEDFEPFLGHWVTPGFAPELRPRHMKIGEIDM